MEHATHLAKIDHRAIVLLGPTGAGKTPLGELIGQRGLWQRTCLHFDFGANLREVVDGNRPDEWIGAGEIEFLRGVLASGALLEDGQFPLAKRVLRCFLTRHRADGQTLIVLNGLPRHAGQARAIDAILEVRAVVHLQCSSETALQRIRTNAGGDRSDRVDDDPEAVRKKVVLFHERTAPLLQHYRSRGTRVVTVAVTAHMTPEEMWDSLNRN